MPIGDVATAWQRHRGSGTIPTSMISDRQHGLVGYFRSPSAIRPSAVRLGRGDLQSPARPPGRCCIGLRSIQETPAIAQRKPDDRYVTLVVRLRGARLQATLAAPSVTQDVGRASSTMLQKPRALRGRATLRSVVAGRAGSASGADDADDHMTAAGPATRENTSNRTDGPFLPNGVIGMASAIGRVLGPLSSARSRNSVQPSVRKGGSTTVLPPKLGSTPGIVNMDDGVGVAVILVRQHHAIG